MMRRDAIIPLTLCLLTLGFATPAAAQLDYQGTGPKAPGDGVEITGPIQTIIKKTRGSETVVRPDWYGLFLLWAKAHSTETLTGLRDPATFDNFTSFMACDWVRDYRKNDVAWPQKQLQIVQTFNEHILNPQTRFRLLTYAVLGPYVAEQQQFVFRPLDNAAFSIKFPEDKIFGAEDDCAPVPKAKPLAPWPQEFLLGFSNPNFIAALPMEKTKAEYFLNNLPKTTKGEPDRRLVVEVEFEVSEFLPPIAGSMPAPDHTLPPVHVGITARRAIIYANADRTKELARVGF